MVILKNVSFRYGADGASAEMPQSLRGIDLTVRDGEFVLITGPSGCGKTTVLRLINGLIPNFYSGELEGEVSVDGIPVSGSELCDTAHRVGTVFQNPRSQFYNVDSTGELAFGCENRGLPENEIFRRIDDTVARFGIESLMDRNIFRLSDGEKQKIACASVDVSGCGVILLDEPSANLDFDSVQALRGMIRQWRSQGKTIIAAEHRIAYLWDLIDRAVIMRDGKIVEELEGDEISSLTAGEVESMGLRSTVMESPEDIALPQIEQGDDIITVRDMAFSYAGAGEKTVNISSLKLAGGEITAVVGANGAGKTTFLNCLCGLERRCNGSLEYRDRSYGRKDRQKLCFMVMQDTGNQLFTESAMDEVLISLPKGTADEEEKAMEILRVLDLDQYASRHPQSLSGGQKQRLAIACALASGRKILLFDEPTSGLDYAHMKETALLFKRLRSMGCTVIVVTHDTELIRQCCTRMVRVGRASEVHP